eukprot:CAMPEP_0113668594 /NCGR_PEP_ID=MMETSP0038_2-20120614/4090_1 /TAXON_ID=2898 /ORGANISM="Cryptomonas paramecium" /LENGTH=207 /DNA_ID=CAMNT_0000584361 /DNA_START=766 /DNA_END=1385 /DNA_ORIENTATION=- /assembly_acc=CAM_ASM_000170
MATSLTGPQEIITSFTKAGVALTCWGVLESPLLAALCAHAGIAALAKLLLQLSVFASIVQALVPFWDPTRGANASTPDVKCRVCFEVSADLRRSPCRCSGSVGYIHPVCFQQWYEMKKSMRCELCHTVFQVRMLPTSAFTNAHSLQSYLGHLLPPLSRRLGVYLGLQALLMCNKLGLLVHDNLAQGLATGVCLARHLAADVVGWAAG